MTLFERTKEIAQKRGYSIAEVERKAGLSENYLYTWKRTDNPRKASIEAVANVLNVSTSELLGEEPTDTSNTAPDHIDVEDIVDNAAMLTSRNHALSDEDRSAIKAMLTGYLNSKEGQRRLKKYGGYGDKNVGENGDD
ncbi:helix-turn-helix domain-containing protein [Levilactobacillus enshiensis]|uniref:helix-turn-helix domain-containing protein n=1 Tax=Levilactobacillus enshiensis TaxID=2590213 RepID=UPI001179CC55|nr:helix-turn-helix transcriptional regulator [Levilactobacillus enshiensis]